MSAGAGSDVRGLRSHRRAGSSAQRVCESPAPGLPAAPKPGISRTPRSTEPSVPAVSHPTCGPHPLPAVTGCHRLYSASASHGVPHPPGCLRAPQISGRLPRASPGPCPPGPLRPPGAVIVSGRRSPGRICLVSPLLTALGRSSGGARAGGAGRHRAGQGAASLHRYLGQPEPGPCSSWPVSHRCPGSPSCCRPGPVGQVPGSSAAERWWRGDIGVRGQWERGRWEQRVMGAARHVSEQGSPGEGERTCRSWAKSRRRALAAPAELTHRPRSLP